RRDQRGPAPAGPGLAPLAGREGARRARGDQPGRAFDGVARLCALRYRDGAQGRTRGGRRAEYTERGRRAADAAEEGIVAKKEVAKKEVTKSGVKALPAKKDGKKPAANRAAAQTDVAR